MKVRLTDEAGSHSDAAQVLRRAEDLIENSHSLFGQYYYILRLSGIYGPEASLSAIESNPVVQGYCWLRELIS
ncbi:MAG: hypothetical protein ACJZ9L_03425 [Coraliomargaritaceae bacterium]